ncbi:MAG: hypothetical protein A3K19_15270 [Lentisphaerae bacterium RIFOXYB12_FULL_65_16]|nr:MAG: hypothetical protein A3K18_06970 [Lentisphaerae bacterium RIFOXYA12_64_32]OGV88452.1 MAG: hypothetical protein A3K19_15270 [Lentisphaerae bacterium RIFOXYB12_FULL_65_16]
MAHVFSGPGMQVRTFAACLTIMVALFAGVHADELVIPRTEAPPTLDGALDDPCWQTAVLLQGFTEPNSFLAARKTVEARACFDDQMLYLGIACAEPHPERIKAGIADGGPVWEDDSVSVCFRGKEAMDVDQLQANSAGARKAVRLRQGAVVPWQPAWETRGRKGDQAWTLELRIPLADLDRATPKRGEMIAVKISRLDLVDGYALSVWPPHATSTYDDGAGYGALYFGGINLIENPEMTDLDGDRPRAWSFHSDFAELLSPDLCRAGRDGDRPVILFSPVRCWCAVSQKLDLQPNRLYRLEAQVRGTVGMGLRVRTKPAADAPDGDKASLFAVQSVPSEDYLPLGVNFSTGPTGETLISLAAGADRPEHRPGATGEVRIADLRVLEVIRAAADGPAIPVAPDAATPLRLVKLPVADCRIVRGFQIAPVDGKLDSIDWDGNTWEYRMNGDAGVHYAYRNNDGLHITLADPGPVHAVLIRGGAGVKLYGAGATYEGPGAAPLLHVFRGYVSTSHALFDVPATGGKFSFFDIADGTISDVSFLRIESGPGDLPQPESWRVGGPIDMAKVSAFLNARFEQSCRSSCALAPAATGTTAPLDMPVRLPVHWISAPLEGEMPLAAIGLDFEAPGAPAGAPLSVRVQDPLNPRAELMGVDLALQGPGRHRIILDFPDQVVPAGVPLWLTVTCDWPAKLAGPDGGAPVVQLYRVDRARALPEALAYRKLLLKGLFACLSEQRPWNRIPPKADIDKWLAAVPTDNPYAINLVAPLRELFDTISQCKALAPADDTVRQYDEWVFQNYRGLQRPDAQVDAVPGAPEWAVVVRQAWRLSRQVPEWWLDNRLVPTGELGGEVGDDTDMFQNYADFPMLENDGVAARIKAAAARLAELAEQDHLEQGLNRGATDPLHAYEEGVNHEALMLWWFYGDPVYVERCMTAARSTEALTTVTALGHRHFKNPRCGAEDLRIDRKLGVEDGLHPLMLHPALEVAWYNRNPRVLKFLTEWADGWLAHQNPGAYASSVDVATEKVLSAAKLPFMDGTWGQGTAMAFIGWVTGEAKYINPFVEGWRAASNSGVADAVAAEMLYRQAFPLDAKLAAHLQTRGGLANLLITGKKDNLLYYIKRDIAELQNFPVMYTSAEPFTDRVFLHTVCGAAAAYTGGFATRNKFTHPHAVSYEGFGTDYAALVLNASRSLFRVLLYNFAEQPREGRMRFWTLEHGRYRLTMGPDADGDDKADQADRQDTVEIQRATAVPVTLPPRQVMVLELQQEQKLDDELLRPDLALSPLDVKVTDGGVEGVAHNIGAAAAPSCEVALLDPSGRVVARQALGPIEAPLDLLPRRQPFSFAGVRPQGDGWRLVLNPSREFSELFDGNNTVAIPPAVAK